jgi:F0F1-type ATP synthase assembly protein I
MKPNRVWEAIGLGYLALFFLVSSIFGIIIAVMGAHTDRRDVTASFILGLTVYSIVSILLMVAAFRAFKNRHGPFQPILLGCLSPIFLGLIIAPFFVLLITKKGFSWRLLALCSPMILGEIVYFTLWIPMLRRMMK